MSPGVERMDSDASVGLLLACCALFGRVEGRLPDMVRLLSAGVLVMRSCACHAPSAEQFGHRTHDGPPLDMMVQR